MKHSKDSESRLSTYDILDREKKRNGVLYSKSVNGRFAALEEEQNSQGRQILARQGKNDGAQGEYS